MKLRDGDQKMPENQENVRTLLIVSNSNLTNSLHSNTQEVNSNNRNTKHARMFA